MRYSLICSLIACSLFPEYILLAQQLPFVNYTPKDGLVSNQARFAYQDSRGQMYFATNGGLSIYDGSVFTNYTTDNGLASSLVNDVVEMGKDSIWVIPNTGKIHCLVSGKLKDLVTADGFCPVINKLIKTKNGFVYALADGGLYKFLGNRFILQVLKDANGRNINNYFTSGLEFDNKLFLITDNTVLTYPAPARLVVYDLLTGKGMINQTVPGIYSVAVSPWEEILAGTFDGLKLIDKPALHEGVVRFGELPPRYRIKKKLVPHYLYFDRQHNFWMLCYNGVQKITANGEVKWLTTENGLSSNYQYSIFQDRENIIWLMNLATGVTKLSNPALEFYKEMKPGFTTSDIYANPRHDSVWFLDGEHKKLLIRSPGQENEYSLLYKLRARRLAVGRGQSYLGADSGVLQFHLSGAVRTVRPRLVYSSVGRTTVEGPMYLQADTSGNPIVVNVNLRAIIGDTIVQYSLGYIADQFFITPDNILWTATRNNKIFVFNLDKKTKNYFHLLKIFDKELPRLSPRSIAVDKSGNVWVGSRDNGLFCFFIGKDLIIRSWQHFTMKDGLSDNYVSYLQSDHMGNIWVGSPVGLDRVQLVNKSVLIENVTRSNNWFQHVVKVQTSANGVNWILSAAGVIKLTPTGYIQKNQKTDIFFTRIQAGNDTIPNSMMNLTLSFRENDISFRMAAPSFIDEKQIRFSYILEGSTNNKWSEPSANPEIRLVNLGPGKYRLHAKAIFLNGIYPETSTKYTFEILPPWWQTWWFRISLILICAGITALIVRAEFNRRLQKQRILLEKQQAIEKERTRIATDMHDDLGAGLSTIRFLSEKVKRNSFNENIRQDADKIASNSNELVEKMNDIIWAMNEKNDSLEDLLFYSRSYAMEYCEDNRLHCNVFLPHPIPDIFISGEIRRNVFLTIKESLHNIVKHASATNVAISFEVHDDLIVTIVDDGKGIEPEDRQAGGNGLLNMQKRISLLNGRLTMKNLNGVTVEFRIPLTTR